MQNESGFKLKTRSLIYHHSFQFIPPTPSVIKKQYFYSVLLCLSRSKILTLNRRSVIYLFVINIRPIYLSFQYGISLSREVKLSLYLLNKHLYLLYL